MASESHPPQKRQHNENENTKDLPHAKRQCRRTDTQTEIQKPSHLEAVERLVKQYTHASHAMASVYAQEIEKVCKLESEKVTNESDNTECEDHVPSNFSYKQPCCNLAGRLRTCMLQDVVCPSNTDLQVPTSKPNNDLSSADTRKDEQQDLPGSASVTPCPSSGSDPPFKQEMSRAKGEDVPSTEVKGLYLGILLVTRRLT